MQKSKKKIFDKILIGIFLLKIRLFISFFSYFFAVARKNGMAKIFFSLTGVTISFFEKITRPIFILADFFLVATNSRSTTSFSLS